MITRENTLFVTHCSAGKNQVRGGPLALYTSERIQRFGKWCKHAGVKWAIVSAEHGLFPPDKRHGPYDTTFTSIYGACFVIKEGEWLPAQESQTHIDRLVEKISGTLKKLGIRQVVFYVGGAFERVSPCYFLVVHRALDKCTQSHGSRQALRQCIDKAGKLRVVTGMFDLEAELGERN